MTANPELATNTTNGTRREQLLSVVLTMTKIFFTNSLRTAWRQLALNTSLFAKQNHLIQEILLKAQSI